MGVAAGFAPLALGAETDGSVVQPASRAGIFALKATPSLVDTSGTQPVNPDFDSLGVMATTSIDIVDLWKHVLGPPTTEDEDIWDKFFPEWTGKSVGFVDLEIWQPEDSVTEANEDFKKQSVSTS